MFNPQYPADCSAVTVASMAPKVTPLWEHFTLQQDQPHIARCHYCEKTISREKEGSNRLNNGGMIKHLQRLHKECFKLYKEKESEGQQKKDSKDETVRGTVPLFSLKNHSERKQFLKLVMKCSIVQRSAV